MYRPGTRRPRKTRIEGQRWLRSDGTPNFADHVYRKEGDVVLVAKKELKTASPVTPVLELAETMSYNNIRSIPIVNSKLELEGLVLSMNIVNYFGGGELYNIVVERHQGNIYSALKEPAESIMIREPITVNVSSKITELLKIMVTEGIGVVPVLDLDNKLYGIITERDLVEYFSEKPETNVKVKDVMTKDVVTIDISANLKKAAETMVKLGFRRLPVVEDGKIAGMLTSKDIVRFIGDHRVFEKAPSGKVEEALSTPVSEVMSKIAYTIGPEEDIAQAARYMMEKGVSSLLVVVDEVLQGIITERDILYGMLVKAKAE